MKKVWPPPGFPVVEGFHRLTSRWAVTLPSPFARRVEDGSLVLWRPGLTVWLDAWGNDHGASQAERLQAMVAEASPKARVVLSSSAGGVTRYAYRLRDRSDDGEVESLNAFVLSDSGHLHMGVYFDDLADEATALAL